MRKEVSSMIISASRRTDIPAFYTPWFMNRVRAGFVDAINRSTASRSAASRCGRRMSTASSSGRRMPRRCCRISQSSAQCTRSTSSSPSRRTATTSSLAYPTSARSSAPSSGCRSNSARRAWSGVTTPSCSTTTTPSSGTCTTLPSCSKCSHRIPTAASSAFSTSTARPSEIQSRSRCARSASPR